MNRLIFNSILNCIWIIVLFPMFLSSCGNNTITNIELPEGTWKAVIRQQDQELPFLFETVKAGYEYQIVIINGEERLVVDEVDIVGDSVFITFNFFDTEVRAKYANNKLIGFYNKRYSDNHIIPFIAEFGNTKRFETNNVSKVNVSGKYEIIFWEEDNTTYPAIAKLTQVDNKVTGTFLTETGDYRYLDGVIDGNSLKLSSFDGTHLFLFTSKVVGDSLTNGKFWHGKYTYETWKGLKNNEAILKDPDKLTFLKKGYDKISFSFPNLEGDMVSLDDPKYSDKIIILQIFGTWCPNCMDETKFYTEWYKDNPNEEVEIIGLAYENKPDFDYAVKRVEKMKQKLGVPYDFLIAGVSDKNEASKTLPMLNGIISFPTSIFIDRTGRIRKIHTGFSGPGTGEDYLEWIQSFEDFMTELIAG